MALKQGFRVGPFEVRPLTGEVGDADGMTHLEPKVIEVLVALAEQPGQVVEREALLQRIWGQRAAVSDEPLTRCIAELRRAFRDSRRDPTFIQTIPKRGYRLLCPVTPLELPAGAELPGAPEQTAAPVRHRWLRMPVIGSGLAVLVLLAVLLVLAKPSARPGAEAPIEPNTLAVLPFTELGTSDDDAYFGDGLAEEILSRLSTVKGLRVVARTSSFAVRDSASDVRDIAARLRVAHVLEGTVRREGEHVRIVAQLIDAERGYQVWAASYDGVLQNIFMLQDDIANAIVAKLGETLRAPLDAASPAPASVPTNPAAYELLLRGRQYLHRRNEESLRHSARLFQQAIDLEPDYGQAYVELAKAYALLPSYSAEIQDEMFDKALATLATGLEHDRSIDAAMQGVVALVSYARWNWIAAEVAFRRALEQSGNDTDLLVWYSQFLADVGRTQESADVARRAHQIDLLSPVVNHRLAVASLWINADADAEHYSDVAAELGMGATANPDSYIVLQLRRHDYDSIRPLLIGVQTMFARPTAWVDPLLAALADPARRPEAVAALVDAEQARDIPRKYLFGAWVYLDEPERAIETGLKLVNDRPSFDVEFLFSREARTLRAHPRFGELLRAVGLTRYWDQFGWPDQCRKQGEVVHCG